MRSVALLGLLSCFLCLLPPAALAQDSQRTGVGALSVGYAALVLGAVSLAAAPVCLASFFPVEARDACFGGSLSLAGISVGVGLPTAMVGKRQQASYRERMSLLRRSPDGSWFASAGPAGLALHYRRAF